MADIVIIGGGIAGLCGSMLLARDGHRVTVLERDNDPPGQPTAAWTDWRRTGVGQFRLPHAFLPRFRALLEAELPEAIDALADNGALLTNRIAQLPDSVTGGWRPGDERFDVITGRRAMVEATLAHLAASEPGVCIRRGVSVRGLVVRRCAKSRVPHVTGVVTADCEVIQADLVVDAGGRRSALPDWLEAVGVPRPVEQRADSGFIYYCRHYRSDGAMPQLLGSPLHAYDSVSTGTLAADNGYWSVLLFGSTTDPIIRSARHVDVWDRVMRSYPLISHWIDAEPVTGVEVFAKIEDRVRTLKVDGRPIVTGVVAVGDARACTNPSVGRGASIAMLQVTCLRDALRKAGTDDALEFLQAWDDINETVVDPLVTDTLRFDCHRRAQMKAQIAGVPYEPDDPGWHFAQRLSATAARDPELLRAAISVLGLLERGVDVARREGIADRMAAVGPVGPLPGPSRAELIELLTR